MAGLVTSALIALAVTTLPFYAAADLAIDWWTALPHLVVSALLGALFVYLVKVPGSANERGLADAMLVAFLLIGLTNIASPAQYLAVSLGRPLVDSQLAAADALLGIHVPDLARWTAGHPWFAAVLDAAYFSLLPQFILPIVVLGIAYRDRARLWEYCYHFYFCLLVTLTSLALWPAECAFLFYGFDATIEQGRFIRDFTALRAGTFSVIRFDDLEGLISMPSFHVAGALAVTWVFRGYRWLYLPLLGLNTGLVLATFLSGAHYFVDVLASFALFYASVASFRILSR